MSYLTDTPGVSRRRLMIGGGRGGRRVAGFLAVVAAVAVGGAPLGLVWSAFAPDVPVVLVEGGVTYAEAQPEQPAAADGWFVLLGLPFGVVAAVGVWLAARPLRGVPGLLSSTAGTVAAALLAWWLGRQLGLADYRAALAAAGVGVELARPADLTAVRLTWWPPWVTGVVLVPAAAAAATYTLLAAWSRFPGLRPAEAAPTPPAAWTVRLEGDPADRVWDEPPEADGPPSHGA